MILYHLFQSLVMSGTPTNITWVALDPEDDSTFDVFEIYDPEFSSIRLRIFEISTDRRYYRDQYTQQILTRDELWTLLNR